MQTFNNWSKVFKFHCRSLNSVLLFCRFQANTKANGSLSCSLLVKQQHQNVPILLFDPDLIVCFIHKWKKKCTLPKSKMHFHMRACVVFLLFFSLSWRRQTPGNDYGRLLQVEIDPEAPVARGGGSGNGPFAFHTTLTMQSHASVIKSTHRFSCRRVSQGLYTCFSFISCFHLFFAFLKVSPLGLIKH